MSMTLKEAADLMRPICARGKMATGESQSAKTWQAVWMLTRAFLEQNPADGESMKIKLLRLLGYVVTVRSTNQREWMEGLRGTINKLLEEIGDDSRVTLRGFNNDLDFVVCTKPSASN